MRPKLVIAGPWSKESAASAGSGFVTVVLPVGVHAGRVFEMATAAKCSNVRFLFILHRIGLSTSIILLLIQVRVVN